MRNVFNNNNKFFMSWRDLVITPFVQIGIIGFSVFVVLLFRKKLSMDLLVSFIIFFIVLQIISILFIRLVLFFYPLKSGICRLNNDLSSYIWSLVSFIAISHLFLLYTNILIPPPLRKLFYQCLGAKIAPGLSIISGKILDPYLVTIGKNVIIGEEVLITSHAISTGNMLFLGKIKINDNAIIGIRSIIMPDVVIGENSLIKPGSIVQTGSRIPSHEVWGGNPARKIDNL